MPFRCLRRFRFVLEFIHGNSKFKFAYNPGVSFHGKLPSEKVSDHFVNAYENSFSGNGLLSAKEDDIDGHVLQEVIYTLRCLQVFKAVAIFENITFLILYQESRDLDEEFRDTVVL